VQSSGAKLLLSRFDPIREGEARAEPGETFRPRIEQGYLATTFPQPNRKPNAGKGSDAHRNPSWRPAGFRQEINLEELSNPLHPFD
jgi:hypothetical protein